MNCGGRFWVSPGHRFRIDSPFKLNGSVECYTRNVKRWRSFRDMLRLLLALDDHYTNLKQSVMAS